MFQWFDKFVYRQPAIWHENAPTICFFSPAQSTQVWTKLVTMNEHAFRKPPGISVYFDGGCPMCAKEIAYYQGLDKGHRVEWIDVAGPNPSCPIGYDQQRLLARFHVKDLATGQIYDGAAGFARLWRAMPTPWKQLGAVASMPPITWILEIGYRLTLKVRPLLAKRFFKST